MSTTKKVKIIVPGSSNADLTGFAPHLPAAGETVMGSSLHIGIGGKGCNQMTAAARSGADAWFITRVGQDVFGETLRRHFAAEGFRDRYIREDGTAETGCALIEIDERDGQNRILVIPGVNRNIGAEDVRAAEADFADADAVLTQLEIDLSAVAEAKRLAQAAGNAKKSATAQKNTADANLYALRGAKTLATLPEEDRAAILSGVRVMRGNSAAGMNTSIPQTFDFSTGKYRVLTEDEYKQIKADYNAAIRRLKESGVSDADIHRMTTTLEQSADAMIAAGGNVQTAAFALQYPTLAWCSAGCTLREKPSGTGP